MHKVDILTDGLQFADRRYATMTQILSFSWRILIAEIKEQYSS